MVQVKKVMSSDLKSIYCCIPAQSPYAEGLPESRKWFEAHFNEHVEGYHLDDGGSVVGHIYFAMSEKALVPYDVESGVACIHCTYLLRDYLHKGLGRMMFDFMKGDLRTQDVKGIMVPATEFKEWMYYGLFIKQGFRIVREQPPYKVMYFPLSKDEIQVEALGLNYTPSKDNVEVTLFRNFFCPVSPFMYRRIKTVAQRFGDKVKIVELGGTLENVRKYGTLEPLINGKIKLYGPTSEEDIMRAIEEEIVELRR